MVDISQCGLYIIIKNPEQIKKTLSIIKELGKRFITLHFETTYDNDKNKKNYLKINEYGFNGKVMFSVKHEMYNDDDKFKCLTEQNAFNTNFSDVCVQLEILDEIFKKLTNNDTVIFYIYINDENLNISVISESTVEENNIATNEVDNDEFLMDNTIPVCQILMKTQLLNETLKSFNKFCSDITLICTPDTFIFKTPQIANSNIVKTKSIKNDKTVSGVHININEKVIDPKNMIIQSTFIMKFLKIISKIDDKFCESVNIYFLQTTINDNYILLLSYSYNSNETMKISFVPKNIDPIKDENSDQIDY